VLVLCDKKSVFFQTGFSYSFFNTLLDQKHIYGSSVILFVIPGLTRNPVFFWIPAFAGMTPSIAINATAYKIPARWRQVEAFD
jgi:hypothetical protein